MKCLVLVYLVAHAMPALHLVSNGQPATNTWNIYGLVLPLCCSIADVIQALQSFPGAFVSPTLRAKEGHLSEETNFPRCCSKVRCSLCIKSTFLPKDVLVDVFPMKKDMQFHSCYLWLSMSAVCTEWEPPCLGSHKLVRWQYGPASPEPDCRRLHACVLFPEHLCQS